MRIAPFDFDDAKKAGEYYNIITKDKSEKPDINVNRQTQLLQIKSPLCHLLFLKASSASLLRYKTIFAILQKFNHPDLVHSLRAATNMQTTEFINDNVKL